MEGNELNVVTGSLGYTGKYITRRLLSLGTKVVTLTGHPNRQNPFGDSVTVRKLDFDNPVQLRKDMHGVKTLYNTYWVRFCRKGVTFDKAVANTKILITAAEEAGVSRVVHISITNVSEDSALPYFRGKAIVERAIISSRLSYAIVRPTVIFGAEDILTDPNIAGRWQVPR